MKRAVCAALLAALPLAASPCAAQQQIEWKQMTSLPKGLNLPKGVKLDVLGIEPGDTYAEAKAKLDRLAAENQQPARQRSPEGRSLAEMSGVDLSPPLTETNTVIRLQAPGGVITAQYVGSIRLKRNLPGASTQKIVEDMTVRFSAPSSGYQVLSVARSINYLNQADQPRVSELVAQLKAKYGSAPQVQEVGSTVTYLFQYDNGNPVTQPNLVTNRCYVYGGDNIQAREVPNINRPGNCDVILMVEVRYGISRDHAATVIFTMSDNERAKANLTTDFGYFQSYVQELQARTRGAPPKL